MLRGGCGKGAEIVIPLPSPEAASSWGIPGGAPPPGHWYPGLVQRSRHIQGQVLGPDAGDRGESWNLGAPAPRDSGQGPPWLSALRLPRPSSLALARSFPPLAPARGRPLPLPPRARCHCPSSQAGAEDRGAGGWLGKSVRQAPGRGPSRQERGRGGRRGRVGWGSPGCEQGGRRYP